MLTLTGIPLSIWNSNVRRYPVSYLLDPAFLFDGQICSCKVKMCADRPSQQKSRRWGAGVRGLPTGQRFSKCSPKTKASAGNLVEMHIPRPCPRPSRSDNQSRAQPPVLCPAPQLPRWPGGKCRLGHGHCTGSELVSAFTASAPGPADEENEASG